MVSVGRSAKCFKGTKATRRLQEKALLPVIFVDGPTRSLVQFRKWNLYGDTPNPQPVNRNRKCPRFSQRSLSPRGGELGALPKRCIAEQIQCWEMLIWSIKRHVVHRVQCSVHYPEIQVTETRVSIGDIESRKWPA